MTTSRSEYFPPVQKNTVYRKHKEALTANDKLRLIYVTGQQETAVAPVDVHTFNGQTQETVDLIHAEVRANEKRRRNLKPPSYS